MQRHVPTNYIKRMQTSNKNVIGHNNYIEWPKHKKQANKIGMTVGRVHHLAMSFRHNYLTCKFSSHIKHKYLCQIDILQDEALAIPMSYYVFYYS